MSTLSLPVSGWPATGIAKLRVWLLDAPTALVAGGSTAWWVREAQANLATLLRTYPRLAHRPRGYVMASLTRLLRQARWKVARRVEVVLLGLRRAMVAVRRHCL